MKFCQHTAGHHVSFCTDILLSLDTIQYIYNILYDYLNILTCLK